MSSLSWTAGCLRKRCVRTRIRTLAPYGAWLAVLAGMLAILCGVKGNDSPASAATTLVLRGGGLDWTSVPTWQVAAPERRNRRGGTKHKAKGQAKKIVPLALPLDQPNEKAVSTPPLKDTAKVAIWLPLSRLSQGLLQIAYLSFASACVRADIGAA